VGALINQASKFTLVIAPKVHFSSMRVTPISLPLRISLDSRTTHHWLGIMVNLDDID
jgi:hypothetical protein